MGCHHMHQSYPILSHVVRMNVVCYMVCGILCVVLTDNDPWLKYCCSAPANPQLLFVVGNAWISSPFPRVSVIYL